MSEASSFAPALTRRFTIEASSIHAAYISGVQWLRSVAVRIDFRREQRVDDVVETETRRVGERRGAVEQIRVAVGAVAEQIAHAFDIAGDDRVAEFLVRIRAMRERLLQRGQRTRVRRGAAAVVVSAARL